MSRCSLPFPAGPAIFRRTFRKLRLRRPIPAFEVEFFPYSDLTHTIRLRRGLAFVRLATLMQDAPRPVLESLAAMLLGRLYRRSVPKAVSTPYLSFVRSLLLQRKLVHHKRRFASKVCQPVGTFYDLRQLFSRLNRIYFEGRFRRPRLGWTGRQACTRLGRYDPIPQAITLSSFLDRRPVPRYVVEFVLFHEMLHMTHPGQHNLCRSYFHTREFRKEERRFRRYAEARAYLGRMC